MDDRNARLPLISVIIPARNAATTLAQTLESLLSQTEQDWEALIIDDGSTDATAEIIAAYTARDDRFVAIQGEGKGVGQTRNLGIAAARGRWLHFLDADDWTDPTFFQKLLHRLGENPDAIVAYCGCRRVMPGGLLSAPCRMPESPEDPFEDFARGCLVAIHAILVDRETVVQLGGFDPELGNCEDWDLWQRVSRLGRRWVLVGEALAYYRTDGPSLSRNVAWLLANSRTIIERGFGDDPRLFPLVPAPRRASPARGSKEQALAYNALWTLGMDCGAGGPGLVDEDMLRPFGDAAKEALPIAEVIFEGLLVGSRSLPSQLAERWPAYGEKLTGLITWLGEVWGDPGAARAMQYHLEERILYSEPFTIPRRLALTQSVRVDIAAPPETRLAPGVDRLYAAFTDGERLRWVMTIAALGTFTPQQWLKVRGIDPKMGFRRWSKPHGLNAWRALLRQGAGIALRQPELLRRRSGVRNILHQATKQARLSVLGALDPPGSHGASLRAVEAWAAEQAQAWGAPDAVQPPPRLHEEDVDPDKRQEHFESLFATEDPWNYGSAYEQQKYARQLELLPEGPLARALELACAEGHFTVHLAPRVGHLLATDISATALGRTRTRCAVHGNIDYQVLDFSAEPIPGDMDVIFCSEVLYYLGSEAELRQIAPKIAAALRPGGRLIMAHANVLTDDPSRTGFDWGSVFGAEVIRRVFGQTPGLMLEQSIETDLYRIDRFRRVAPDEPQAAPEIRRLPLVEALDPDVARNIVWGGAKVLRSQAIGSERRFHVPVLMYHAISEDGPGGLSRYRITPSMFKAQLRWLRANGYYSIGSEQLAAQIASGEPFAGRPVMLSFDDGFQDFAENAWPLLVQHDFTAEMFVVTGRVGGCALWDEKLGDPPRLMDAGTIVRLAAEGMLFGSHLATHRPVDGLSSLELAEELAGSRAMLAHWLGKPPVSFAAPFTITDNRLGDLAAQTGYRIGFGNRTGVARLDADPLNLPRILVDGAWTLDEFILCMEHSL
jgi:peptidoglycan/xylan/chitin deacetylase (PgdA/CDA1 family)/GT2 family glycosyltransferase/2-polyprenyl-3-methyl-5-hydroxy-6-metoxy-1,4-benzoquinol methylase